MVAPALAIHADVYREAKLALLSMRARQQIERTDASMRKVKQALARFADGKQAPSAVSSRL
jgi:hypothetical protein